MKCRKAFVNVSVKREQKVKAFMRVSLFIEGRDANAEFLNAERVPLPGRRPKNYWKIDGLSEASFAPKVTPFSKIF